MVSTLVNSCVWYDNQSNLVPRVTISASGRPTLINLHELCAAGGQAASVCIASNKTNRRIARRDQHRFAILAMYIIMYLRIMRNFRYYNSLVE
jgi:hypothetical protein